MVEESLGGLGFAFDFPNASIAYIIRLLTERRDEGWIEPLDTVIRLGGKIPVVQVRSHERTRGLRGPPPRRLHGRTNPG